MSNPLITDEFDDIENAEAGSNLPKIVPGEYQLQVEALKFIKSKKGKGTFAIGEFSVISSAGEGANPTGSRIAHMIKMALPSSKGNVKSLIAAVSGEGEKNVTSTLAKEAFSDDQPCKGQVVKASAFNITTGAGKPFTVVKYETLAK